MANAHKNLRTIEDEFEIMLCELLTERLEVVLFPAPRPQHAYHCIRAAISHNPEWYSKLYASLGYANRRSVESALRKLSKGIFTRSVYKWKLIAIARERMSDEQNSKKQDTKRLVRLRSSELEAFSFGYERKEAFAV